MPHGGGGTPAAGTAGVSNMVQRGWGGGSTDQSDSASEMLGVRAGRGGRSMRSIRIVTGTTLLRHLLYPTPPAGDVANLIPFPLHSIWDAGLARSPSCRWVN